MSRFEQLPNNSQLVHYNHPLFPVYAEHERLSQHPDSRMLIHWHNDFELVHIRDGSFTYIVNSQSFVMQTGDVIFVNSGQLHGIEPVSGFDCDYSVVLIEPSILTANPYISRTVIEPLLKCDAFPYVRFKGEDAEAFGKFTEQIIELCASGEEGYSLEVISIAHLLLKKLIPFYHQTGLAFDQSETDRHLQSQRRMLTFIAEHYPEKITLDDIAISGHVSSTTCSRLFRQYLQQSPISYLMNYRLDVGSRLLVSTNDSIAEIAQSCGFSQQSYFCREFQKRYSSTPIQYRKMHTQNDKPVRL